MIQDNQRFPQENNFDLLRLFAALQVAIIHGFEHFKLAGKSPVADFIVHNILVYFPGVPIFFSMSGFLIYASYEKKRDIKVYAKNRFLRLYPGLWVSFIVTIGILFSFRFFSNVNVRQLSIWVIGQLSFFQFYTPLFLRGYGLGNPNGSLWTIVVELQFYILVPVLFFLLKELRIKKNLLVSTIIILSVLLNFFSNRQVESGTVLGKLIGVFLLPYLFYFLFGVLVFINFAQIKRFVEGKALISFSAYVIYYFFVSVFGKLYNPGYWINFFGLINSALLTWLVFSAAFSRRELSKNLLRKNDLSYGLYIYHAIVLNLLIQLNVSFNFFNFTVYIFISLVIALLSWKLVEQPALKLKRSPAALLVQ